ncbi:MAG: S24 family peptidase [Candidatus Saccharimonadales bacterium]
MSDEQDDVGVSVHAGFPNPAADRSLEVIDLHKLVVKQPTSTFFMKIDGNDWEDRSVFDGDIVVIDRSLSPRKTDLVIVSKDADFLITPFAKVTEDSTLFGVVSAVVHRYRT